MQSKPRPLDVQAGLDVFLGVAFATLAEGEKVALSNAYVKRDGESAFPPHRWATGSPVRPFGLHFNCAAFKVAAAHARMTEATRAHVIMIDDVGDMPGKSKAPLDRVMALSIPPHAVVATRRDAEGRINCQACWFIVPVSTDAAKALVRAAARAGWGDPNAVSPVQWARPPGSLKLDGNGFPAELVMSNLDAPRIGIGVLAEALGVPAFLDNSSSDRSVSRETLKLPPSVLVRDAVMTMANDLEREDWIRVGLSLKACCGPPPALDDREGFILFEMFSRRHPSFNLRDTVKAWRSFTPSQIGPGTLFHLARARGWRGRDAWIEECFRREAEAARRFNDVESLARGVPNA